MVIGFLWAERKIPEPAERSTADEAWLVAEYIEHKAKPFIQTIQNKHFIDIC